MKTNRLARIKPAELFICREGSAPEAEWIPFGEGVAAYESDS
ncbi:hypothetical protein N7333_12340 [Pseudomonas sp. GD04158]|nr:hypothetical protein [Pseudomonas sp. GD04158]MDH0097365.1 hypothetical protein [Pseudomonas sp. GD04158]